MIMRDRGERGFCQAGILPWISSFGPHHGEERVISGIHGSGTVFFTGCSLGCIFCQNDEISHRCRGQEITGDELAETFLHLQNQGCHNINLVTPTHQVAAIMDALCMAAERGLTLPIVYNTGGYDNPEVLRLLDGVIDIYMPDAKFFRAETATTLAGVPDYPGIMQEAIREMHRQTGELVIRNGIAVHGLLIRHLLIPGFLEDSAEICRFIARELSPETWVHLMDQYHPAGRVLADLDSSSPLKRRITMGEWKEACRSAYRAGLHRVEGCSGTI